MPSLASSGLPRSRQAARHPPPRGGSLDNAHAGEGILWSKLREWWEEDILEDFQTPGW